MTEIPGFLMNEIILVKMNGIERFFGSLTDGEFKIEFNLFDIKILPNIEIGTKLELYGDLELTSNYKIY